MGIKEQQKSNISKFIKIQEQRERTHQVGGGKNTPDVSISAIFSTPPQN